MYKRPPNWSHPKKFAARLETIVNPYREWSGRQHLHFNQVYITLAGAPGGDRTEIKTVTELEPLVRKSRFYGIDLDARAIQANMKVHPESKWFYGSWIHILYKLLNHINLQPGIVHLDTFARADKREVLRLAGRTLNILANRRSNGGIKRPVMVVVNTIRKRRNRRRVASKDVFVKRLGPLLNDPDDRIKCDQRCYSYSQDGNTLMTSYIFYVE